MRIGSRPAATADDISTNVKALVDRVLEADITDTIAQRGRELAAAVGEATDAAVDRAGETWRDTAPARRQAMKNISRASSDASKWGNRTWRRDLQPRVRDLWKRRAVALGAAGAAIPAGRELTGMAAARLGLKRREERHWGAFFLGLLLGAAGGVIVAFLTAPKRGSELREELVERAQEAKEVVTEKAAVVTEKAVAVAENAGEWVPLFQRDEQAAVASPPESVTDTTADVESAAHESDTSSMAPADETPDASDDGMEATAAAVSDVALDAGEPGDEMTNAVAQEVDEREGA